MLENYPQLNESGAFNPYDFIILNIAKLGGKFIAPKLWDAFIFTKFLPKCS